MSAQPPASALSAATAPTLALVPLRAGSKGLPGKNTRLLAGRPLYAHALEQARAAGIGQALVTSDIAELAHVDLGPGARFALRPAHLAQDMTPMDAVLTHVLTRDAPGTATIVLLQATSPLRAPEDIARAIALHATGAHALVLSVTRAESGVLKWGTGAEGRFEPLSRNPAHCFTNRAELPPVYRPDGAVYVFGSDAYLRAGSLGALAEGGMGMIETPPERAHDIDTLADFERVAALLEAGA